MIATASLLISGFYSLWLYSTYLVPEKYGVMALALTMMTYLPMLDGGFRTVINRAVLSSADAAGRDELLGFGQKLYSLLGAGLLIGNLGVMGVYAWMPSVREQGIPVSLLLFYGLTNGLVGIANIQLAVFLGLQQQSKIFLLQTLGVWASVITLTWTFAEQWGLWALVASSLAGFVAMYPLCIRWLKRANPQLKIIDFGMGPSFRKNFDRLKSEAGYCFRTQIVTLVLYSADILIIGYVATKAEVAVYYVLIRLISMLRSFLQTGGEVGWPFFAQQGGAQREDAIGWFGLHGWIYGSVAGALCVVTIPFCRWYLGADWTVDAPLLWAVVLRFLIVGLGSSATYLLYSTGHFRTITRCLEAELVASVVLALAGAYLAGTLGVAIGFLLGTSCGTLVPVYAAYARYGTATFAEVFTTAWSRAILGFVVSLVTTAVLIKLLKQGYFAPVVASLGITSALFLALAVASARTGFTFGFGARQVRQLLRKV